MGKHKESKNPVFERKKNAIMRNYRKFLKAKHKNLNSNFKHKNEEKNTNSGGDKKSFFKQALSEYERRKAVRERIKQIKEEKRKEREEALRKYAEKKRANFIKATKKTRRGQPVMSGRMEILLEKIQKSYTSETIK